MRLPSDLGCACAPIAAKSLKFTRVAAARPLPHEQELIPTDLRGIRQARRHKPLEQWMGRVGFR
jgi:hypothetical protein